LPLQAWPGHAKADIVLTHSVTPFFDAALVGATEEVIA
jgi:hypothetical protein